MPSSAPATSIEHSPIQSFGADILGMTQAELAIISAFSGKKYKQCSGRNCAFYASSPYEISFSDLVTKTSSHPDQGVVLGGYFMVAIKGQAAFRFDYIDREGSVSDKRYLFASFTDPQFASLFINYDSSVEAVDTALVSYYFK